MLGSAMAASTARHHDISTSSTGTPKVTRTLAGEPLRTARPFKARSSSAREGATRSTSFARSASSAVNERLSSTAFSASAASRPLRAASERISAAASCSTFLAISPWMFSP